MQYSWCLKWLCYYNCFEIMTRNWLVYTAWRWMINRGCSSRLGCFIKGCFNLRIRCYSSWCRRIIILTVPVDCQFIKVYFAQIKEWSYQCLLLIKVTWARESNCWNKAFSFVGWKNVILLGVFKKINIIWCAAYIILHINSSHNTNSY